MSHRIIETNNANKIETTMIPQLLWKRKQKILPVIILIVIVLWILIKILYVPGKFDYGDIKTQVHCEENAKYNGQKYVLIPMNTVFNEFGLGNQLFETFSLLGIANLLNRTAIFNVDDQKVQRNLRYLRERLPQVVNQVISVPINKTDTLRFDYPEACCQYMFPRIMTCEQSKYLLIHGRFFQSFKYFSSIDTKIRNLMNPPRDKEKRLRQLVPKEDESLFKTCVHVRRGDFVGAGGFVATDSSFTINAISHLYKLNAGLVYMFSNDNEWVRKNVVDKMEFRGNVRIMNTTGEDAFMDLYFSRIYCDSVLITASSSTFGWWLGYLSKNQSTVYYRDIDESGDTTRFQMIQEDFFPPEWKRMKMSQNGRVSVSK